MNRRTFVTALGAVLAAPLAAEAQQAGKVWRIGILHVIPPDASRGFEALRQGLRSLGYVDGQNIGLEYRWSERPESLSTSVMELLRLKVHVIVTADATIAAVAKRATSDTPIVMAGLGAVPCRAARGRRGAGGKDGPRTMVASQRPLGSCYGALREKIDVGLLAYRNGSARSPDRTFRGVSVPW
jgi:hypothetical protein